MRRHRWAEVSRTSHYSITENACRRGMPHQHMTIMTTLEKPSSIAIITVTGDAIDDVTVTLHNAEMDLVTPSR